MPPSSRRTAFALLVLTLAPGGAAVTQGRGGERAAGAPRASDLLRALRDPAPPVRHRAVMALGRLGDADLPVALALAHVLRDDPAVWVRSSGAAVLGWLGAGARAAVRDTIAAALGAGLTDSDATVRLNAAQALRDVGRPAAPYDLLALRSGDPAVRRTAVLALGEQAPTGEGVSALAGLLDDTDADVRGAASRALGGFGAAAAAAVRTLAEGPDSLARRGAAAVLGYVARVDSTPAAGKCFRLSLAPWRPSRAAGADPRVAPPPAVVRLSAVWAGRRAPWIPRPAYRLFSADRAHPALPHESVWRPITGTDSLYLAIGDGRMGISMRLRAAGDTLRGVARPEGDARARRRATPATAVRTACP